MSHIGVDYRAIFMTRLKCEEFLPIPLNNVKGATIAYHDLAPRWSPAAHNCAVNSHIPQRLPVDTSSCFILGGWFSWGDSGLPPCPIFNHSDQSAYTRPRSSSGHWLITCDYHSFHTLAAAFLVWNFGIAVLHIYFLILNAGDKGNMEGPFAVLVCESELMVNTTLPLLNTLLTPLIIISKSQVLKRKVMIDW